MGKESFIQISLQEIEEVYLTFLVKCGDAAIEVFLQGLIMIFQSSVEVPVFILIHPVKLKVKATIIGIQIYSVR